MKLKYDNLVIGGSFDALYLAFSEGYPIIFKDLEKPFKQDKIGDTNKKDFYEMMLFLLGISNLNLFYSKVQDIRIEGNKVIVSGKKPWIHELEITNIHDFRDEKTRTFKVVDTVSLTSMGPHNVFEIKTKDKFVKEVYIEFVRKHQIAKVVSYLTQAELNKEDFSPVYSRLRLKQLLKENGIKGRKKCIEVRPGFKAGQRYTPPRLEFVSREIHKFSREKKEYVPKSKDPYIQRLMEIMNDARKSPKAKQFPPSWFDPC